MYSIRTLACAILAVIPLWAVAQPTPAPIAADPASPIAPAAPMAYVSAFAGYQPLVDEGDPTERWQQANDEVGQQGGHAGHMKDEKGTAAPASSGHGGMHHGQKEK
jgi:hypothetical protein